MCALVIAVPAGAAHAYEEFGQQLKRRRLQVSPGAPGLSWAEVSVAARARRPPRRLRPSPDVFVRLTSEHYCLAMDDSQWPGEWMRGVLSLCVLSIVAEGETYGYVVAQRLQEAGLGAVKGGTLYPVLTRLELDGLLVSSWREGAGGPGRKFFTVTPSGRSALAGRSTEWTIFADRASALITSRKVT